MDYTKVNDLLKLSYKQIQKLPKNTQIEVLQKLVEYHNKQYFIKNDPVISDEYFDKLYERLKKLNPSNPALFKIVGEIGSVTHPYPLLSIDKKFNFEDIAKWVKDVGDNYYLVEPKYDGMRAMYNKQTGVLATRGNGRQGEDITERFKHLNVKGSIKKEGQFVEGEIVIPTEFFNKHLANDYKNSRNAVVGIVKSKVVKKAGIQALLKGGVHFVLYDQVFSQKVNKNDLTKKERFKEILEEAFHSPYPLDGVVIKATSLKIREKLGATAHHERWQVAYKTPAEKKWSKIKDITDQVGRTGRITSVAHIKPVNLSGATVKNVTLHNFDYIKKEQIGVGAKVEVMRSGEVIPFITQVINKGKPHTPPKKCPVCGKSVKKDGKYLVCVNKECPAKVSGSIEHYFKALGVEELGEKTINRFINEFKLKKIIDFYNLTKKQIAPLDGFGQKSAENIVKNIKQTLNKNVTKVDFINALGIKEVGRSTAKLILQKYKFSNLPNLSVTDLQQIKGIGPSIAHSFVNEINEKWDLYKKLKQKGLQFKTANKSNKLKGLSFCITGKKQKLSRNDLIDIINNNGGTYKPSVTKDLNYLIAGEDAGSKLAKANHLGVKVITEEDFLNMVG